MMVVILFTPRFDYKPNLTKGYLKYDVRGIMITGFFSHDSPQRSDTIIP